ncbi:MAG: MATE family efflux transporter [Patescibacteria group bacterium]|nr:MATE family efflux transporter [Patescibacteria group bacterium]
MKKIKFETSMIRPLLTLAIPIMLGNLFQAAYQLTDAFWVGRLGEKAVAAIAVSFPIIFFITALGIGFAIAGATLTAQYFGAKKKDLINHSATQTIFVVIVSALTLSILGYFLSDTILNWLRVNSSILDLAARYLKISFLGMVFNFSFFMFQAIMRSIGKPKIPVYIIIFTVALNFFLDPLFMFGQGPVPALGVAGTALATVTTQAIAASIGLFILFSGKFGIKIDIKNFKPDFKFIKKIMRLGIPASLEQSARSLSLAVMTTLTASFGTLAVAAYGISSNILQLSLMASFGLAGANAVLVGQKLGAGYKKDAFRAATTSLRLIFTLLIFIGGLVFLLAPLLIKFFIPDDAAVIAEGANLLRFLAPTFSLIGLQVVVGSTLQAAGATKKAMILTISSQWLLQIPLAFILSKFLGYGVTGIWLAFPLTNFIMALIYLSVFHKRKWQNKKIINTEEKIVNTVIKERNLEEIIRVE